MIKRIYKKLEKFGVVADVDYEAIGEDIEFDFIEYTNFINEKYKPWAGGDWIRNSDGKIIYNPLEILEDFVNSRNEI